MARDLTEGIEKTLAESPAVRATAQATQRALTGTIFSPPLRPLKTLLNGTWLEHPLHPVITDVPVGAWTVSILLDLLALVFRVKRLGRASAIANGTGIVGALGAAATGAADWVDVDPPELSVGIVHALTNVVATLFFTIAFFARRADRWKIKPRSFIPALLGYVTVTVGAYLGGPLVFQQGVMINRNAYRAGPMDFTPVMAEGDLPENTPVRVPVRGVPVLLVRRGTQIHALGAVCSHYGGPLEEGQLKDGMIECPWHDSHFALADGSVRAGPATAPIPVYETRINDGQIEIRARSS